MKTQNVCQCKVVVQNDGVGIHCRCVRPSSGNKACTRCLAGEHFTLNYNPITTLVKKPRRRGTADAVV